MVAGTPRLAPATFRPARLKLRTTLTADYATIATAYAQVDRRPRASLYVMQHSAFVVAMLVGSTVTDSQSGPCLLRLGVFALARRRCCFIEFPDWPVRAADLS